MRVLVLGVTGMLGHTLWHSLGENSELDVWATCRNTSKLVHSSVKERSQLINDLDVLNQDDLIRVFEQVRPDVVINCIGLIKQLSSAKDPLTVLPINALFPHRLAKICALTHSRLIHISTDCVFSGKKGAYVESDPSDAEDLYGKSKFMGELNDLVNVVTLRTSIIGHELNSQYALIDWFLSQENKVKGYVNAIFSGLPTIELSRVIRDYVLPNKDLAGLYHVAAQPIGKYDLLKIVAEIYNKKIIIEPDHHLCIDRSLCAARFEEQTGYLAPTWPMLIEKMHQSKKLVGAV
ncbi:dTDP-4-dehydrorhamnose reductase family protein [Legionella fallonii]|uniref:dTDP-4-dehydrorhamnose reductase n=1 Tax=Legionella fallonii LLAP-10 TaxID=1212491 RepID=A0A098G181_9GAMM|nr:SDR family oxidoreductase [Legionella fallonii]CEG56238.1 putative dTDP-4-dehydrorhamnose reductase [Legionella fallonii LLAP-10]